jgi:hypothetical protein
MKTICWCVVGLLCPMPVCATIIDTQTLMEEHIDELDKTASSTGSNGLVYSYVASDPGPDHYLQGSAYAQATGSGGLFVSAVGTDDTDTGDAAYFRASASWCDTVVGTGSDYSFFLDLSDVNVGSNYMAGIGNSVEYSVDVWLNGESVYSYAYLFDSTTLAAEYLAATMNGNPTGLAGETYFSFAGEDALVDLGYYGVGESFTLAYTIVAQAQPVDMASCYINLGASGQVSAVSGSLAAGSTAAPAPVPEPATCTLFGLGMFSLAGALRRKQKARGTQDA